MNHTHLDIGRVFTPVQRAIDFFEKYDILING